MNIDRCALIGTSLKSNELSPVTSQIIEYETDIVGKVKITIAAYQELISGDFERFLIAGICKQRTIMGLEPVLIDFSFIREGYKDFSPPVSFDEKRFQLIKNLHLLYGREHRDFNIQAGRDFCLGFCDSEEFERLMKKLIDDNLIRCEHPQRMGRHDFYFRSCHVTSLGIKEAEKALPKMPLFGLVNQSITTGDFKIDNRINHARALFFKTPQTLDNMRSACETLSHVLEPLRENLETVISKKDISSFFEMVNKFDIRHNKEYTKNLTMPEQLEWIFYSLLNSINMYYKLKIK